MENRVIQVGSLANQVVSNRINPNRHRVYLITGISPCLDSMNGGGRQPEIIIHVSNERL